MRTVNVVTLFRLLATRHAIERIMWAQRAESVRAWLMTVRQTAP